MTVRRLVPLALVAALLLYAMPPAAADEHEEGVAFVLNILGKAKTMPASTGGPAGGRLFVPLTGECRIDLAMGTTFGVEDGDCTDPTHLARVRLLSPAVNESGYASYSVWVRALGKPGGSASMTTCKQTSDGTWCNSGSVQIVRAAGIPATQDSSQDLLTVCADSDGDGELEREPLFADENAGYYWKYASSKMRHAQLKFVMEPVFVMAPC